MQPDLSIRRQRIAARLSQMATAKVLGQLKKLVSVLTLWTQGNCLGWGPSDRTGLAGTEYNRTLNRVVRALQSLLRRQFFKLAGWFSSYHL